jgi:hypothetical protein
MTSTSIAPPATPLAAPDAAPVTAPNPVPVAADPTPPATAPTPAIPVGAVAGVQSDPEARSFGKAVLIGSVLGIVVMSAFLTLATWLVAPDFGWPSAVGVGVWTGLWTGGFLGGTITVGRWSARNH